MEGQKIISIEDRIPKLKQQRKKKTNRRLIFLLSVFFLLIIMIVYLQSPLSKVTTIDVVGNNITDSKVIKKESSIVKDTSIWSLKKDKIQQNLKSIPQIKRASISIGFPNKVIIHVTEQKQIGYLSKNGKMFPILEDGRIIEKAVNQQTYSYPVMTGFNKGTELSSLMKQISKMPKAITNNVSEIHYAPNKTDNDHITMYMNDGNEVSAVISSLAEKMSHYSSIVSQLGKNEKGVIDFEVGSYFKAFSK